MRRHQYFFTAFFLTCTSLLVVPALHAQTITNNQTGIHDGYFYSLWNDGDGGPVALTLGPGGNYGFQWSEVNSAFGGKGWETGGRRTVHYQVNNFEPGGNTYMGIYGWTVNPRREYYIVENWGTWRPNAGTALGTVTTDGATYDIYMRTVARPDLYYDIFWSVRRNKSTSGTITTGNHFDAWADLGMELGDFDYMIFSTEGYQSTGHADVTIWEGEQGNMCEVCNWYGWHLPLCANQDNGWGWEAGQSCVGRNTCNTPWGANVEEVECDSN